jgi:cation transport ATPase
MDNGKLYSIILYVLLGVSGLLSILYMFTDSISEGFMLNWCYFLLGLAVLVAVAFSILGMVSNIKKAKSSLIGLVAVVVVFAIGYALAGSEEFYTVDGNLLADAATSKKSEAGLIAFYIMGAISILTIIYAEVSKMLK